MLITFCCNFKIVLHNNLNHVYQSFIEKEVEWLQPSQLNWHRPQRTDNMRPPFPEGGHFFIKMCLTFYNNFGNILLLRVRKKKVKIMSESEIIEFVQNNARYYDDDSFEPYAVLFQGESFWGESPRDLVNQISETLNS